MASMAIAPEVASMAPLPAPIVPAQNPFDSAPTYEEGESFTWTLPPGYDTSLFPSSQLVVRVDQTFLPFSCSPVMRVSFDTRHGTRTGILKTYDRREGSVSRVLPGSDEHVDYDSSYEGDLMALVSEGEHVPVFDEVIYGYRDPARMDLSTPARQECFFQALRLEEFSNETMAYEALRHLQGDCVPGFYTSMTWTPDCKNGQALMIGAVLIEEIEGAKTLQDFWDDIGDENYEESLLFGYISREEKRVQASVEDAGVFDGDRHAGNTLIVLDNLQQGYIKLIQIDFGFARTGLAEDVLQLERELEELEEELEDSLN